MEPLADEMDEGAGAAGDMLHLDDLHDEEMENNIGEENEPDHHQL